MEAKSGVLEGMGRGQSGVRRGGAEGGGARVGDRSLKTLQDCKVGPVCYGSYGGYPRLKKK